MKLTAAEKLLNSLNTILAGFDKKVLEDTKEKMLERRLKLHEYKKNTEYSFSSEYYSALYDICGGKTWYNIINNHSEEDLLIIIEKNCANVVKKRNASIAKKLEKAGITEVLEEKYSTTSDGYNGVYTINTDSGTKSVIIETILAGGYNIQCLHHRVLVKVK
jgi:hypothetical protein